LELLQVWLGPQTEPLEIIGRGFLQAGCSSVHSVRALNGTQSTDL